MSRGLSNRNPGNIRQSAVRYKGEVRPSRDPAFKQFESMPWGYRAIFVLLDTYRIRHGLDTIRGMISRWAPPSENRTEIYIRAVADAVGIADDRPVDTRDRTTMLRMAAAISRVENGTAADMDGSYFANSSGESRPIRRPHENLLPEQHTKQPSFVIFAGMKPEFLLAKLDRMPMLKAVVPFAAGILAADRFALPLWFCSPASRRCFSGRRSAPSPCSSRRDSARHSSAIPDARYLTGYTRPMNSPSRASPPTGAAMLPPKRPSRRGATRPTARGTPQATG